MKSRRVLAEEQFNLVKDIRDKLDLNIVTCGNCGAVLFHKSDVENIHCYQCNEQMEPCDCPDLWYDSDINNYEDVISIEPTKEISVDDVVRVAMDLGMNPSIGEINEVLKYYDSEAENDPTATWDFIVENLLYNCVGTN